LPAYFGSNIDFPTHWLWQFIVALVKMTAFTVTDAIWRATAQPWVALLGAKLIAIDDILYFQSDETHTRVVLSTTEVLIRKPIKE
jgi:DNA-binding LytR/AlgR family response regulator